MLSGPGSMRFIKKGDYCYISNLFINVYDGTEYKMADMRDTYSNEESYMVSIDLVHRTLKST